MTQKTKIKIILIGVVFLAFPFFASADYSGQKVNFLIDSAYDISNRSQISATLRKITSKLYFYIDDNWWDSLSYDQQNKIDTALLSLSSEFPWLTPLK